SGLTAANIRVTGTGANAKVEIDTDATDFGYVEVTLNAANLANVIFVASSANSGADTLFTLGSPPTVTGVTSSTANGAYKVGSAISIQVTFSEAVTVTGTPQLTLETGTTDRTINYASGTGTSTLTFTYTVQAGDTASDLDYLSTSALTLNGGTIQSSGGADAILTLATPGATNSLGANKAIIIDTTAPGTPTTSIDLGASSDAGASNSDDITNVTAPTVRISLTGTSAVAGDSVELLLGGSSLSHATTATLTSTDITNGYVDVTVTAGDLGADGTKTLTARVTDAAGNVGTAGGSLSITLDTAASTTTIATAAFSADTAANGGTNSDFITKTAAQTISGTLSANLAAGETVYVSLDNGSNWTAATTTVGQNSWSLSGQTLTGSSTLKVKVTDTAGNDGTVYSQAYVLDTTAPTKTIATASFSADTAANGGTNTDWITKTAAQTVSGTLSANV
ncbi:Ig-like domain-containing protein, partial [Niveispirillum sp. SYP-B3756]|uniref:beta strand repeat-containing protein n=1 Tax=Niveispirillum sp. SYP-B3756 TaxID=2662178 RepID=UPI001FFE7E09